MTLFALGWDDFFGKSFHPFCPTRLLPARVVLEHKQAYELLGPQGALHAVCTGKLLHDAVDRQALPAVGDWVVVSIRPGEAQADIHAVLPRKTKFSRCTAGARAAEQIVAANVDTVFLVTALDRNYNLRRIERYLTVARESGAAPVVVLNKADLCVDPRRVQCEVEAIAGGAPVVTLSALPTSDLSFGHASPSLLAPDLALAPWLRSGRTVALLGSSGVGKSTLINRILGTERQVTSVTSPAVNKGRHTTTHRELIVAPSGALVIDTPGMRELQLWDVEVAALDETFADVTALAARCRFHDCSHRTEPGCAVQAALDAGTLGADRWASFQKLEREQAYAARRADPRLERATKSQWKSLNRALRARLRMKEDGP